MVLSRCLFVSESSQGMSENYLEWQPNGLYLNMIMDGVSYKVYTH